MKCPCHSISPIQVKVSIRGRGGQQSLNVDVVFERPLGVKTQLATFLLYFQSIPHLPYLAQNQVFFCLYCADLGEEVVP